MRIALTTVTKLILGATLGIVLFVPGTAAGQSGGPSPCPNDSKLLNGGPTAVYGEGSGTFWNLVINGLNAAGFVTDEQKVAYLSQVFGVEFTTLAEARDYNLDALSAAFDTNQNGYVCAYELRGTRRYAGDPYLNLTTFGVSDDRIAASSLP
jgi:hypothetical protein